MFDLNKIINTPPFSMSQIEKEGLYLSSLNLLTEYHYRKCHKYRKMVNILHGGLKKFQTVADIPFIPVRLFKEFELLSIDKSEVVKTMTSSGTSGQQVSKIYLDKITASFQSKVLVKIISSISGSKRLPMLVVDTNQVVKDRKLFSARGAGVLGFSMVGYDITYALNEDMNLDIQTIQDFLLRHKDEDILVFGFTSIIWQNFLCKLKDSNIKLQIDRGILVHGGGWKKLVEASVDNETFKKSIKNLIGASKIFNYYGMVEQTGSIFMECEKGYLHASIFSDILVRNFKDFSLVESGKKGLIQLVSLLPFSYPGHSLITEDVGEIFGVDDCLCGRKGKYFKVYGRIQNAEVRGCSDAYEFGK